MSATEPSTELQFEPPGPGSWGLDALHFPRPVTRYWAETHPAPFRRGCQEYARYYGMLSDGRDVRYVNGFCYGTLVRIPDDEIPARARRAEEVFAGKLWREQLRDWDEHFKPASIAIHRELQSVDPEALSDAELQAYVTRCRDHHAEMIYQHMRFTGAAMIAVGDLLVHAGDWTGEKPAQLLGMLRGAAPVSAGASGELADLIAAVDGDPAARELLESGEDPALVLAQLRALDGEAGRAASAYLDLVGCRLLDGFDISGRYALEMPEALLRAIRASVAGADGDEDAARDEGAARDEAGARGEDAARDEGGVDATIAGIRDKVPEEHRDEFDELLGEARLMYRVRDERGVFSDIWASGIMRRAALGAGRRLAAAGRLHDPEHFVDAGREEMLALLSGDEEPSADELAGRHAWRTSHTAKEAPRTLGPPAPAPPDPSTLPPAAARVMRAMGITAQSVSVSSKARHEEGVLRGFGASTGVYEGPARRVAGPADFDRIVQGDVLVTEATSEAFNILLPLLGAIVTDTGGVLSHAAIVAREYGLPAVVGTRNATDRVADGARVRVDGDAAEVTLLG